MFVVGRQPHSGLPRRSQHRAVCGGIHAIEADISLQHLGRCLGRRNPPSDGLGRCRRTECHNRRWMERTRIQSLQHRRLASRRLALRLAISTLQWPELDHPGRIQARRSSNARMDQSAHERPRRASLCRATLPHLRRPVVVPDHRPGVSDHEQYRERMDRARGLAVLEEGRPKGKREGLVLG